MCRVLNEMPGEIAELHLSDYIEPGKPARMGNPRARAAKRRTL